MVLLGIEPGLLSSDTHLLRITTTLNNSGKTVIESTLYATGIVKRSREKLKVFLLKIKQRKTARFVSMSPHHSLQHMIGKNFVHGKWSCPKIFPPFARWLSLKKITTVMVFLTTDSGWRSYARRFTWWKHNLTYQVWGISTHQKSIMLIIPHQLEKEPNAFILIFLSNILVILSTISTKSWVVWLSSLTFFSRSIKFRLRHINQLSSQYIHASNSPQGTRFWSTSAWPFTKPYNT